jgi:hypothetical protein
MIFCTGLSSGADSQVLPVGKAVCRFETTLSMTAVWNDPVLGDSGPYDPGDYEHMLNADYTYIDCEGIRHVAPRGFIFNGASIPRALWTLGGYTPLSGKVQGPAIIHDFLCTKVMFTSRKVHGIFREGLIATGVSKLDAAVMYAAVKYFGPKWSEPGGEVTRPTFSQAIFDLIVHAIKFESDLTIYPVIGPDAPCCGQAPSVKTIYELRPGTLQLDDVNQIDSLLAKFDQLSENVIRDLRITGRSERFGWR